MNLLSYDYEVVGTPISTLMNELTRNGGTRGFADGSVIVNKDVTYRAEARGEFKQAVRKVRKGEKNMRTVHFPEKMGKIKWITTVESALYVSIMFRHDPMIAHNYNEYGEHPEDHYQPQIYFVVRIDKDDNTKGIFPLSSPFVISNHVFPHQSGASSSRLYNGYCDGSYGTTKRDALLSNDLSAALSIFVGYLANGTNREDSYGMSCTYFREDATMSGTCAVNSVEDAHLVSYIMLDEEVPFGMGRGMYGVNFASKEMETAYLSEVAVRTEEIKQRTEA